VLHIPGAESAIAFFQARDRLGRRHNWLIGMSRISSSAKLASATQTDRD
jgi:hypothetical protein